MCEVKNNKRKANGKRKVTKVKQTAAARPKGGGRRRPGKFFDHVGSFEKDRKRREEFSGN